MTREEVQDLLAMIQAAFPNYNPADKTAAVNAWYLALSDMNGKMVAAALKGYMRTNTTGFAPSPGQLIAQLQTLQEPQSMNELEAWAMVSKAIRNSIYNSEQEFASFPETVQKAVGSAGQLRIWAMDENYNEGVASSNFMRAYRTETERAEMMAKLPDSMRRLIQKVNSAPYKPHIGTKTQRVDTLSIEGSKNDSGANLKG